MLGSQRGEQFNTWRILLRNGETARDSVAQDSFIDISCYINLAEVTQVGFDLWMSGATAPSLTTRPWVLLEEVECDGFLYQGYTRNMVEFTELFSQGWGSNPTWDSELFNYVTLPGTQLYTYAEQTNTFSGIAQKIFQKDDIFNNCKILNFFFFFVMCP